METIGDQDVQDDWSSSSFRVLQQISEEAVRVAGEALQNVYTGSSNDSPLAPVHRRSQSEVVNGLHRRNNSFQKLKSQVQKAWRGVSNLGEQGGRPNFNPEILANQKRQWYQIHSKNLGVKKYKEPTSLFEHFIVAGLPSDSNLETVEEAFVKRKKWESAMAKSEIIDLKLLQSQGPSLPTLEPQILFRYPPGKKLALRLKDLAAFCFPGGVKARLLERSPSLSDLNELVYGQGHLGSDDLSFIFSLKVADGGTLFGVCLHVPEIVQRPPGILGASSPLSLSSGGCSHFLVSAPRCYCVLTRVPFFELHYEMLNSIIAQERLSRITQFISEMSLCDYVPSASKLNGQVNDNIDSSGREPCTDWMSSAIPLDTAVALTAAAAGIISDDEVPSSPSLKTWEPPQSPESFTISEADLNQLSYENGTNSPEVGSFAYSRSCTPEWVGSSDSVFSPVRSMVSEDEDDDFFSTYEKDAGDGEIMEWARDNKNDLLQIVCGYHALPVPARGSKIIFQPLEHLQAIEFTRPTISAQGSRESYLDQRLQVSLDAAEVNGKLAAADEAVALSMWATATICRSLSLDSVLTLLAGVLLEKQVVIVCPNLGVLSATVLSLVPMIRPFEWQSLLLPVLPEKMLDFLDAPVPFIAGIQHKPDDLKIKTSSLIFVNVLKDQVKSCHLPSLPRHKELFSALRPVHARLACEASEAKKHPVYKCSEVQANAAAQFLVIIRQYMESLCSDLRNHTITSVQSNKDRVSLLLKDSFIDSFPSRDRAFVKLLVDTQLFSVLSDSHLSSYEHE